jgi:hypothetical protein
MPTSRVLDPMTMFGSTVEVPTRLSRLRLSARPFCLAHIEENDRPSQLARIVQFLELLGLPRWVFWQLWRKFPWLRSESGSENASTMS